MARNEVVYVREFSNVDEMFDKMLELGFFVNEAHRDEEKSELPKHEENWFSNRVVEVKILRSFNGSYRLFNFRGIRHRMIDELLETAERSSNA